MRVVERKQSWWLEHRELELQRIAFGEMCKLVDHTLRHEHCSRGLDGAPLPAGNLRLQRRVSDAHVRHDARWEIVRLELSGIEQLRLIRARIPAQVMSARRVHQMLRPSDDAPSIVESSAHQVIAG